MEPNQNLFLAPILGSLLNLLSLFETVFLQPQGKGPPFSVVISLVTAKPRVRLWLGPMAQNAWCLIVNLLFCHYMGGREVVMLVGWMDAHDFTIIEAIRFEPPLVFVFHSFFFFFSCSHHPPSHAHQLLLFFSYFNHVFVTRKFSGELSE